MAVRFAAGKAEMQVNDLPMPDYGTKANSLGKNWQTAFDPGVVSFDVVWGRPVTRQVSVPNGTLGNHYAGEYVENQVTVTWSGTNLKTGFTFTANPGTLATSSFDGGFAELGRERNGSFLTDDEGEDDSGPAGEQSALGERSGDGSGRTPEAAGSTAGVAGSKGALADRTALDAAALAAAQRAAGPAHARVLDRVFADPDALGADEALAWAV